MTTPLAGPLYAHRPPGVPVVTTIHGPLTTGHAGLTGIWPRTPPSSAFPKTSAAAVSDLPIAAVIHHGMDFPQVTVGRGGGGYACFVGACARTKGSWKLWPLPAKPASRCASLPRCTPRMSKATSMTWCSQSLGPRVRNSLARTFRSGEIRTDGGAMALLNPIQWHEPFGLVDDRGARHRNTCTATPMGAAPEILNPRT